VNGESGSLSISPDDRLVPFLGYCDVIEKGRD
jgi:hypothetical protein